jgi:HSP20 family protein
MADIKRDLQKRETSRPEQGERTRQRRVYTPDVDIVEKNDEIVVIADMPGVDEKSVEVILEKNLLTIYGKVDAEIPENHRLLVSEYGIGDFQRAFTLSDEVEREKIMATVKNGVLKLILPKIESIKTKKIPVIAEA